MAADFSHKHKECPEIKSKPNLNYLSPTIEMTRKIRREHENVVINSHHNYVSKFGH